MNKDAVEENGMSDEQKKTRKSKDRKRELIASPTTVDEVKRVKSDGGEMVLNQSIRIEYLPLQFFYGIECCSVLL